MTAGRRRRDRRLHEVLVEAGLPQVAAAVRRQGHREHVHQPRHAGHQRQDGELRPLVRADEEAPRHHEDLALPARPRRPVRLPPRALGRHPAPLVRQPADGHQERHPQGAAGRRRDDARPLGHLRHLAGLRQQPAADVPRTTAPSPRAPPRTARTSSSTTPARARRRRSPRAPTPTGCSTSSGASSTTCGSAASPRST